MDQAVAEVSHRRCAESLCAPAAVGACWRRLKSDRRCLQGAAGASEAAAGAAAAAAAPAPAAVPPAALPAEAAPAASQQQQQEQQQEGEQQQEQQQEGEQQQAATSRQQQQLSASAGSQPPPPTTAAGASVAELVQRLRHIAANGGQPASLMPHLQQFGRESQQALQALHSAAAAVANLTSERLEAAALADLRLLRQAIEAASGAQLSTLQAALQGVQQLQWVPPQAVVTTVSHTGDVKPIISDELLAEDELLPHLSHASQAVIQAVRRIAERLQSRALRREADSLPSLEGVEPPPLQAASTAAAALSQPAKLPPSKQRRGALHRFSRVLWTVVDPQGESL